MHVAVTSSSHAAYTQVQCWAQAQWRQTRPHMPQGKTCSCHASKAVLRSQPPATTNHHRATNTT